MVIKEIYIKINILKIILKSDKMILNNKKERIIKTDNNYINKMKLNNLNIDNIVKKILYKIILKDKMMISINNNKRVNNSIITKINNNNLIIKENNYNILLRKVFKF